MTTDSQVREDTAQRPAARGAVLAALMLTMALAAMDTTIVSTAIPQVVGELGGYSAFGWVFSGYLLAQTVSIPVYGRLADTYGRKPVLMVGALIFLVGSAACAAAPSMLMLIVFRALQGLGAGSVQATVTTLAADLYPLRERGRVQGLISSVWGIAAVVGPTLGGAFAEYTSWRWIFLVNLPIGVAALVLIGRYLTEHVPQRDGRPRIDYPGATLVLLAASALFLGLLAGGETWPWLSVPSLVVFGTAIALGVAVIAVERRAAEPVMPLWVWSDAKLRSANLAMLGLGLLVIGPTTFVPTYAQSLLGVPPTVAGLMLAAMSITWPTFAALSAKLYLRIGFTRTATIGAGICVLACLGMATLPADASRIWQLPLCTLVLGAGFGLLSTSTVVGVQSSVDWNVRGTVTGANMFCRYLGQSLGAAVYGAVSNARISAALADAPAGVPRKVDQVTEALRHASPTAGPVLRSALFSGVHSVFVALAAVAVLTTLLLIRAPKMDVISA